MKISGHICPPACLNILILLLATFSCINTTAQDDGIVPSEEYLEKGIALHDSGYYEKALEQFEAVHPGDTNYLVALVEISNSLYGLERYNEVVKVCREGLAIPNKREAMLYNNIGNAYDELEQREKAMAAYDKGLEHFPLNHLLYYNKGTTLVRMDRYAEALKCFQKALQINPKHFNSHMMLGTLAYQEEQMVPAMLSYATCLMLEPTTERGRTALRYLDFTANTEFQHESNDLSLGELSNFSKLERLLQNKAALSKKYKIDSKLKVTLTKQLYALLDEVEYHDGDMNFWMQFYIPFYKKLMEDEQFEGFSYYIMLSTESQEIIGRLERELSDIKNFNDWLSENWETVFVERYIALDHKLKKQHCLNAQSGYLIGVGTLTPDLQTTVDDWTFYHPNGNAAAIGTFNSKGERNGLWRYYHENGILKDSSYYENNALEGGFVTYHKNGAKSIEGSAVNDELEGLHKEHNYFGDLQVKRKYEKGKYIDSIIYYYPDGTVDGLLPVKEKGEFTGSFTQFHADGSKSMEATVKQGELDGLRTLYYPSGQVKSEYQYEEGAANGPYKEYHPNGNLKAEGEYLNGALVGIDKTYYLGGTINEIGEFDEKGKEKGIKKVYDRDGVLHYKWHFRKGEIVEYQYFDKEGNVLNEDKRRFNRFAFKGFYPDGSLRFEGDYVKDNKDGKWKYYSSNGNLRTVENHDEGNLEGVVKTYHANGEVRMTKTYESDVAHGPETRHYSNGKTRVTGWNEDGERSGLWKSYYIDGTLQSETYYSSGEKNGWGYNYAVNGNRQMAYYHENGTDIMAISYDTMGAPFDTVRQKHATGNRIIRYEHGQARIDGNKIAGKWYGPYTFYYGTGAKELAGKFKNGERHGKWTYYYPDGTLKRERYYRLGQRDSVWITYNEDGTIHETEEYEYGEANGVDSTYHSNGKLDITTAYYNDRQHGPRTFYYLDGTPMVSRLYSHGKFYAYVDHSNNDTTFVENESVSVNTFFKNGNPSASYEFDQGMLQGPYVLYHPNGEVWEKKEYTDGLASGVFKTYYDDGSIWKVKSFLFGQLQGKSKLYYKNGQLKSVATYKLDDKHGPATGYTENGKKKYERNWYDNDLVSEKTFDF